MSTVSGNRDKEFLADAASRYRTVDFEAGREASVLARALELAADAAKRPVSAEDAWRAASAHAAQDADWLEVATSAARALGLHAHPYRDGGVTTPPERAAIVRLGEGRWLVAVGRHGRRIRVVQFDERGEQIRYMRRDRLREVTAGQPWLQIQPLLALDPVSTTRSPSLAGHPWRRLRAFLQLERREIWVLFIYAMVVGGLTLATPIAVQALVNTVAFGAVLQPLVVLTILLFGVLFFAGILRVLEAYVVEVLQRRVFVRMADDFGRRLPTVQGDVLERHYGPELVNRFFEVVSIQKSLSGLLLDGLALALQTAIGMILLAFYHPLLLAFDVILVILLVAVIFMGRGAIAAGLDESHAKYRTAAWLEDVSRVPHLFRGASGVDHAAHRTEMLCRDYLSARRSHFRILLRQITGGIGLQVLATGALLGVGGWLVIERQLTLGQLVAAELVVAAMGAGFIKLGKHLEKVYDLNVGIVKAAHVIDLPTERRGGEPLGRGGPASVALRGLTLVRGGRSIISKAELEIAPGERLLVEGATGAGKSTLLDGLAALRESTEGCLKVDGLDLRRADLSTVRERVVLVRGTDFIEGTVSENIRLGQLGLDEPRIRKLLRLVDLDTVIDCLPKGLETPMLPSGAPFSDTQQRRLTLVRALAAAPRVLLVDGGFDGLGLSGESKNRLLDEILGPAAPWTAVVVTDDPEVAARCGRRVRVQSGTLEVVQ